MESQKESVIPDEVKRAVSAVDNELRWKMIEILLRNGEMSYTQLIEALKIRKGSLTYHLNQLLKGAILDNYARERFASPYDSYYSLSTYGRDFLSSLFKSIEPPSQFTFVRATVPTQTRPFEINTYFGPEVAVFAQTWRMSGVGAASLAYEPSRKVRIPAANQGMPAVAMVPNR